MSDGCKRLALTDISARLAELKKIYDEASAAGSLPVRSEEVNNHVHSCYSFSPYNPSQIAYMAWQAGLQAVGIMDHDSFAGAEELVEACKILGLGSTCGIELRVNADGTSMEGRSLNNPGSSGIFYMAIHGIPLKEAGVVAEFLKPIQKARNERNRKQVEKLNEIISEWGIPAIDYDGDVYGFSEAAGGGAITERHILNALAIKLTEHFGKGSELVEALSTKMELEVPASVREYLIDADNPHYIYDLLGFLKGRFQPRFFIQPNKEECINVAETVGFAKKIGAISAYAYLGDVGESPTGDKKAEKFEDSFLDELMSELKNIGFQAVTFMPPRNSLQQLQRVMALCEDHGFMQISGVDINSSRQSFSCPDVLKPEFRHLNTSTWALIAHEKAGNEIDGGGLFSSNSAAPADMTLNERIEFYARLGEKMDLHKLNIREVIAGMSYSSSAPILRGAIKNSETGPIIQAISGSDISGNIMELDFGSCSSDEQKAAAAVKAVEAFRAANECEPDYIRIAGEGSFKVLDPCRAETGGNAGRMSGRVSLVTGGAQGFGEEIVRNLVSEGAFVFIADLNISKAEELASELNSAAGADVCRGVKVDVSDEDSVKQMVKAVAGISGGLDLFVNNAGVLRAGSVKSLEKRDFDFVTSINYTAYFLCVKHVSQLMALQNLADGSYMTDIIQINSKSGLEGSNKNGAYAGGKFGGIGLTQSFALELMDDNIKVNSICPGNFFEGPLWSDPDRGLFVQYLNAGKVPGAKTIEDVKKFYEAKVPMGRGCRGEDVARAIYYAVEQKYETGQAIPVTGGQIMLN